MLVDEIARGDKISLPARPSAVVFQGPGWPLPEPVAGPQPVWPA